MPDGGDCKVTCTLVLRFASEDDATKVLDTVDMDNAGYVDAGQDGDSVTATIRAESLNSLLHTLDDFLACVAVADKIITR